MNAYRFGTLLVCLCCNLYCTAHADIILDLDENTFETSNGTDYQVDAKVIVNDDNDPDLTNKTQTSGVNFLLTFDTVQAGVEFVDVVAPSENALFSSGNYTGGGDPTQYLFGSVDAATDPLLENKNLFTLQFKVPSGFSGNVDITVNANDVIFNSGPATFFVQTSNGTNIPFDSLSGASVAIPEPNGLALGALGFGLLGILSMSGNARKILLSCLSRLRR